MSLNKTRRWIVAAGVLLAATEFSCVPADTGNGTEPLVGGTTSGPKVLYKQILEGFFQTVFFDNLPFPDGPTYGFEGGELTTVFDFLGDGQLLLDFVSKTPGAILVNNTSAPVLPGTSRVIRGGLILSFSGNVSNNNGAGPFLLTDAAQDFLALVEVGDTVEIEGGSGAVPGTYRVIDVSASALTLETNAGDTGGAGDLVYNVRNDGDTVLVRFDLAVNNPDGSRRTIDVGLALSFSYDGQFLVGDFHSMSVTTLGSAVQETLDSGVLNILLQRTESLIEAPAVDSGAIPTSQPSGE